MSSPWPSLKRAQMLRVLAALGYSVVRQQGSHCRLEAPGRPVIVAFSFHERATVPPRVVRDILVRQVGLSVDEALEAVKRA